MANIMPVIMAGLAIGKIIRHKVSALVAPSAKLPWRIAEGIRESPSSVDTITTGKVKIAKVSADHITPGVPNVGLGRVSA